MDFFTNLDSPVAVNFDGKPYPLSRFVLRHFKQWSADLRKEQEDHAVDGLEPEAAARVKMYFAPIIDISDLLMRVPTPEGAEYVVNSQLKEAGVPDDARAKALANASVRDLRDLALELTRAPEALNRLGVTDAEKKDPLPESKGESEGSPATGAQTAPDSTPSTT